MVKFGQRLEKDAAVFEGTPELQQVLAYKAFKKLLKCAKESAISTAGLAEDAARQNLSTPFWNWPQDAEDARAGAAAAADSPAEQIPGQAWFCALFEKKLSTEAEQIQGNISVVQQRITEMLASLATRRSSMSSNGTVNTQDHVKSIIDLQSEIQELETKLDLYVHLNYTAFFKIIKKYDKAGDILGRSDFMARLMPLVDSTIAPDLHRAQSQPPLGQPHDPDKLKRFRDLQDVYKLQCDELLDNDEESVASEQERKVSVVGGGILNQVLLQKGLAKLRPPILSVLKSGYGREQLVADLQAAFVISVAGIPKAMSYAALAGLPMSAGIATLYIPCIIYALLGSSRQVAISPQSVTCLLLAQIVDDTLSGGGFEDHEFERRKIVMLYTLFTGLVIMAFGAFNLVFLVNFISKPVLSGFISASAIIAALSTLKTLLGISVKKSPIAHVLLSRIYEHLPEWHWPTALIGGVGILMMFGVPMLQKIVLRRTEGSRPFYMRAVRGSMKIPAVLFVVVAGILAGGQLCRFLVFDHWTPRHVIKGRGATSMSLLHNNVAGVFDCHHYDDYAVVKYESTGSGDGLGSVLRAAPTVDFAFTDKLPPAQDLADHSVQAFPVAESIVCPVVNVPLVHGTNQVSLVLDLKTLADIFSGEIRYWADHRIRDLNPNLPWKSIESTTPIYVVVRSDLSGTTQTFSNALSSCEGCNSSIAPGLQVDWGATTKNAVRKNYGVVRAVSNTEWSIGYTTFGEAQNNGGSRVHCAALMFGGLVRTAGAAWSMGQEWPLMHTTFVMLPQMDAIRLPTDIPRSGACTARKFLHAYLDELYASQEFAAEAYLRLAPWPRALDGLPCGNDEHRRLKSKSKKCKAHTPSCEHVKMVGFIQSELPLYEKPSPSTSIPMGVLLVNAALLACVALLEHVANVKLYADRYDYDVSLSTDLVAVGMSNVIGACFGSFIVAGGFSRSALNAKAASQVSGLMAVPISFAVVMLVAPALSMLPQAVLNAILFVAVITLVDVKIVLELVRLRRKGLQDLIALIIAFAGTCFFGVVQGMVFAIMFSLVMFIFNSTYPQIVELRRVPGSMHYEALRPESAAATCGALSSHATSTRAASGILVLRFESPMWFANITRFSDFVMAQLKAGDISGLVLDMSGTPSVDPTAGMALKKLLASLAAREVRVAFAATQRDAQAMIRQVCGLNGSLFHETIFDAEKCLKAYVASVDLEVGESKCEVIDSTMVVQKSEVTTL
jgi:MFS superfamily sulfate permease-like transporter